METSKNNVEVVGTGRNFEQIQDELYLHRDAPDLARERELRIERARLINEAKEVGVLDSLKRKLLDIQTNNSFFESVALIDAINVNRLEDEARGLRDWDEKFSGLFQAYKEGALRNMSLAFLRRTGAPQDEIISLEREIELLNWGTPPAVVDTLAVNPNEKPSNLVIDENLLAQKIAEAQGLLSPRDYLRQYVTAEDFVSAPISIVPGAEPRFWPILSEEERNEWYVRSTLITAAYKKKTAGSTDKLYMAEMNEFAVDLNKKSLQIIFAKAGVLPAASIYATFIGDPMFYKEEESPKDFLLDDEVSDEVKSAIEKDFGSDILLELLKEKGRLEENYPSSIFTKEEQAFRNLRESIRYWLVAKGRDLLLTDEELINRGGFFGIDKNGAEKTKAQKQAYEILKSRARDAEQIAWNFIFVTSLLEHFDSRQYRPQRAGRLGPHTYWNLFQWMVMHPQERFEQKIVRYQNDDVEGKEEWAALGTWALKNASRGLWTVVENGKKKVKFPRILPDTLIYSALHPAKYQETLKADKGVGFDIFNGLGKRLLFKTEEVKKDEITKVINWNQVSDAPFVPFIFDEMRWADVVFQVFKKGIASEIELPDFGEAVRNLRLDNDTREKLLITYYGADPSSSKLEYRGGKIKWAGVKSGANQLYPNFFLKK